MCGWLLLEDMGCLKWEPPVYRIEPLDLWPRGFVVCVDASLALLVQPV